METFKKSLDNFFKWVKGTELVELTDIDVKEDPVRPELDLEYRTSYGRKIFGLKYQDIEEWDSIGHMTLISNLEEKFGITFSTDDIVDFSSYKKGMDIIKNYIK